VILSDNHNNSKEYGMQYPVERECERRALRAAMLLPLIPVISFIYCIQTPKLISREIQ
jgi:hypothetical protein